MDSQDGGSCCEAYNRSTNLCNIPLDTPHAALFAISIIEDISPLLDPNKQPLTCIHYPFVWI